MAYILLVEDDPTTGFIEKAVLEKAGLSVTLVNNGSAVIGAMKQKKPDLVVLDLVLPSRMGVDILSDISAEPEFKGVPVIACSGSADERDDLYQQFRKRFLELRGEEPVIVNKIPKPGESQIELTQTVLAILKKNGL